MQVTKIEYAGKPDTVYVTVINDRGKEVRFRHHTGEPVVGYGRDGAMEIKQAANEYLADLSALRPVDRLLQLSKECRKRRDNRMDLIRETLESDMSGDDKFHVVMDHQHYVELEQDLHRNIRLAAELMGIDLTVARMVREREENVRALARAIVDSSK